MANDEKPHPAGPDAERVVVVRDGAGRHALWPAARVLPAGWRVVLADAPRSDALAHVDAAWRDMAPRRAAEPWTADVPAALPDLLAARAHETPDAPAILQDGDILTRRDLDLAANRIAHALIGAGVRPGAIVAVALARRPQAVAAFLGVMRAGAAFLPVDPIHPEERIRLVVEDAGAALILADTGFAAPEGILLLDPARLLAGLPDTPPAVALSPRDLAYVVYTSGSTGRPKGVAVEHGPLAMHVLTTAAEYEMDARSRELHFLSFAFDGAHERWMVPLAAGGSIVLRADALWTAAETLAVIRRFGVTHAGFPTSYMAQLAEWAESLGSDVPPVHCYSFGGEAMPRATFERIARSLRPRILINGYGPTETVISPLVWKVGPEAGFPEPYAPIGSPVGDRKAYVLSPDLEPVADGETGELYLGGDGLARGYLARPGLTAERFLPDPFSARPGRMYRTGDLVRRREGGSLAYVGRDDGQVKIRGHRIELGEIEARLCDQPAVAEAVVLRRDGRAGPRLDAYVTAAPGARPDPARLRGALARELPEPLVPRRVLVLPRLPLTPNGKVDRKGLPDPAFDDGPALPPRTATERRVAALLADVLGLSEVGVDRAFFDLGGDSLSALRLLARLRLAFPGRPLGPADLLGNPTVAELSARLDGRGGDLDAGPGAPVVHLSRGGSRPPLVLFPGLLVSLREYEPLVRRLGPDQPAFGFVCASLTEESRSLPALADLADAYAAAVRHRVGPEGCVFLGWSWGGVLAYETARRLQGDVPVRFVGMLDVCGLERAFDTRLAVGMAEEERMRLRGEIAEWLAGSAMRADWEALIAGASPDAEARLLRFLSAEPQPLPQDGPELGSRERILFTLLDHALAFGPATLAPSDIPVRSFEAEYSRRDGRPLIDWVPLARLESFAFVPATDHLDIVLSPAFHDRFAEALADAAPAVPRRRLA